MGSAFSFLIFVVIIVNVIKSISKAQNGTKRSNIQQARTQQNVNQKGSQNHTYYYGEQQRTTKERLQQKYGKQPKGDILSRAKENVRENDQDKFAQEMHAEVCSEYKGHVSDNPNLKEHQAHSEECIDAQESDILKRVNDLIIMGYSGNMEFERDFVAEGVEMLNKFGAS